jgi:hypothetical protein
MIANRADLKDRRKGNVATAASLARDRLGLDLADITEDEHGTRY